MDGKSFCFIILHYASAKDTSRCVDSILKLKTACRVSVIVVDNGCGLKRESLPKGDCIQLVTLSHNKGFSEANNAGYRYMLEKGRPDFCIVANNDIVFGQVDFLERIEREYEKSSFYVLGPDIVVPGLNWHQSPLALRCMDREQAADRVKNLAFYQKHYILHFLKEGAFMRIHNILCRLGLLIRIKRIIGKGRLPVYTGRYENVCFMGACLIFSERYIQKNDRLFYPETFLYFEEDILAYNCEKNGWKTVYSPELSVLHKGSSATKKSGSNLLLRDRRTVERMYEAAKVYCEYRRKD